MKNRYKLWIVLSLIIVFAAGVAGGFLLEKTLSDRSHRKDRKEKSVRFPTLETMAEQLRLTIDQQEEIRIFFKLNEDEFHTLRKDMRERLSTMRVRLIDNIKSVLDQKQTEKFEAMIENYLALRKKQSERKKNHSNGERNQKGDNR